MIDPTHPFANIASTGSEESRELDRKTFNLYILYQASRALSTVLEVNELLSLTVDMTTEVMNVEWGFFYLVNEEQDSLELRAVKAIRLTGIPQTLRMGEGVAEWVKAKVEFIPFEKVSPESMLQKSFPDMMNLSRFRPSMLVPIFSQMRFVGILVLGRKLDGESFTENDLELLSTMGSLAANAIVNAHLYELAILDGTTRLHVARYFRQRLKEEVKRAKRYNQPLALIMLDLDHFKEVNDTYGHPTGDRLLAEVGAIIRKCSRELIDIPCRYGGEEFSILLPETDVAGGLQVAERIRTAVDATMFLKENLHMSVSAGIAFYPADAATPEELVERADLALYEAKRLGRNQVVVYSESGVKSRR